MKDWRGTEIEVGQLVLWGSGERNHGIGHVKSITRTDHKYYGPLIHCDPLFATASGSGRNLRSSSVTVLTEDLLELIPR